MILVTGGTGFIGQVLIRHLVDSGYAVRTLIRPSKTSPHLPSNVPVEVAVSALNDERGLSAAMVGVDTVFHLAGVERRGASADLLETDVQGTRNVLRAAREGRVDRFFYLSHLGADRASAFPVHKAKAIAEEHIRRSGLDYTILRTAVIFGPRDGFTTGLVRLLTSVPFVFFLPGDGSNLIQPLWVEDLATCLTWALDLEDTRNRTLEIGGPEYLTFQEVVTTVMRKLGLQKTLLPTAFPLLRLFTVVLEYILPSSPVSVFWLDYLATNRTCPLDAIPRTFNLLPSRFSKRLDYLNDPSLRKALRKGFFRRPST